MIASLPMYDIPGGDWRIDELWNDIRDRLRADGIDAPETLTRSGDPHDDWANPNLLLSQTCGLPFRAGLHENLTLVAAPAIWVPDVDAETGESVTCPPGQYYSVIVSCKSDKRTEFANFHGAHLAYNDPLSQSGWGLMHQLCLKEGVTFASATKTGSHRASALAVLKERADIAAIDVATWFGPLARDRWRKDLKIIARTAYSPALPYVTAMPHLKDQLFRALKAATSYTYGDKADLPPLQDSLNIAPEGVVEADIDAYIAIPLPPHPPG